MNVKITLRYYSVTCALLLLLSMGVAAQEADNGLSPAALEWMKINGLWRQTPNAAGMLLGDTAVYSELSAGFDTYRGSFRRPEQGDQENNLTFSAEGAEKLKKTYVWGRFDYSRQTLRGALYNASLVDPFRGMPYYVIDQNASDWNNQRYDLAFKAAYPTSSKILFGIESSYKAWIGAKQRDIRVDSRFYTIDVKPSVVYSVTPRHHIGFNLHYYNLKEYSEMSVVNLYILQDAYEMYGLGNARKNAGINNGREGVYIGNNVGFGIQYAYDGAVRFLLASDFDKKVEDVQIGQMTPRDEGTVKDVQWRTRLQALYKGQTWSHAFTLEYDYRHIDGIEYVTMLNDSTGWDKLHSDVRSKYRTQRIGGGYTLFGNGSDGYRKQIGLDIMYTKKQDDYLLPASRLDYENIFLTVQAKRNYLLSARLQKRLLVGASVSYNFNLSGNYRYGGNYPDYPSVIGLMQSDIDYLSADYSLGSISATYSQRVNTHSGATAFAKATFTYSRAEEEVLGSRTYLQLSIGCNF